MPISVRVLDSRIGTSLAGARPTDILVGPNSEMKTIIRLIRMRAQQFSGMHALELYAHGKAVTEDHAARSVFSGGMGILLGKEGITPSTLWQLAPLAQEFVSGSLCTVLACGAAGGGAGTMFAGEGISLMRDLAATLGVVVRASDSVQDYLVDKGKTTGVQFGQWEGNVYLFDPRTGRKSLDTASMPGKRG